LPPEQELEQAAPIVRWPLRRSQRRGLASVGADTLETLRFPWHGGLAAAGADPIGLASGSWAAAAAVPLSLEGHDEGEVEQFTEFLHDQQDVLYVADATLGTPPVPVRVIIDTGSSDLWVKGSATEQGKSYDWRSSTSAEPQTVPSVDLHYGQGQVSGVEVKDRFCLAGAPPRFLSHGIPSHVPKPLCVDKQAFVFAKSVKGIGDVPLFDGLLGLAYPGLAHVNSGITFLQSMSGAFRHVAFSVSLHSNSEVGQDGSFIAIGESEDLQREAERSGRGPGVELRIWAINGRALYWLVRTYISVAPPSTDNGVGPQVPAFAVLDSGTSLIAAPLAMYGPLLAATLAGDKWQNCTSTLPGSVGFVVCLCEVKLNPITLSFVGVNGRNLNVTLTSEDLLQYIGETNLKQRICRIGLMPGPPSLNLWILGDVFLRRIYSVHDFENHKVVLYPEPGASSSGKLVANQGRTASVAVASSSLPSAEAGVLAAVAAVALVLAAVVNKMRPAPQRQEALADEVAPRSHYARL